VDFDMDLHRDAASAFGPASLTEGGMLPFPGRSLLTSADGLPPAAFDAQGDGWISPHNPLLVRGDATILPLAWRGGAQGTGVDPTEIAAFASQMQNAGMYWAGNWRVLALDQKRTDSIGSYTSALCTAGATHVDCWTYSEAVGLALVWAGAEEEGTLSLALHIVPVSWVSEPRVAKPVSGIDVGWTWADVIALSGSRPSAEDIE
jgi:hypothetical protein